jgi:hypothetical protein
LGPDLFGYQYVIGRIDCLRARLAKLSSGSGKRQAKNLMDQDREITREELHHLVWSKPTRIAAKEFGLSNDRTLTI